MECPKCGGGTYLHEEELVQVLEGTRPLKAVLKATMVCRACAEKFSRLFVDTLENRKPPVSSPGTAQSGPYAMVPRVVSDFKDEPAEGLRFF